MLTEFRRLWTPLLSTVSALAVALPIARADGSGGTPTIVGGDPFFEAWVDPCNGDDAAGQVGDPNLPYKTPNAAISAVASEPVSAASPGLVHADPGIYSPDTNGEALPVVLKGFVNVQGKGAKRTVIRGGGGGFAQTVFYPTPNATGCNCGSYTSKQVLVTYDEVDTPYDEMFDGFTLQGGDVQVYITRESLGTARISNCVFDMLDMSDVGVPGPDFGILMVHVYDPSGYRDFPLNILNNTFIQGWIGNENQPSLTFRAKDGSVAICDVNDPLCGKPFPDPDPSLRGLGNPNIQNNLIRYVETPGASFTSFLGVDSGDTAAAFGTLLGPTNAFDPGTATADNGVYCSMLLGTGSLPVEAVNPIPTAGGADPAFVGEMSTNVGGAPLTAGRDWRLLFDSNLVDAGSSPSPLGLFQGGILRAVNGTEYNEPDRLPESSFDFDGEYYGNARVLGAAPDIGFDEVGTWIVTAYANDTRTFGPGVCPTSCFGVPAGLPYRVLLTPSTGKLDVYEANGGPSLLTMPPAWTTQPGTIVPPVPIPPLGLAWINLPGPAPTILKASMAPGVYTAPGDTVPHSFGYAFPTEYLPLGTDLCVFRDEQAVWWPAGGTPVLTNYQASYASIDLP